MSKIYDKLSKKLIHFIENQHIFFVATAPIDGRINISPKGMDTFKVLNENKAVWLNYTGSGNETAAHIFENQRMTIMFCSFEEKPLILRLYAKAKVIQSDDNEWKNYTAFWDNSSAKRQIFVLDIHSVQISCGFSVPYYEYKGVRETLHHHWGQKTEEEIEDYQKEKNHLSIDGLPTGI